MKSLKQFLTENIKFDIDYALRIVNEPYGVDIKRLSHHLYDVPQDSLVAIKKEFDKNPKHAKLFARATKGMSPIE